MVLFGSFWQSSDCCELSTSCQRRTDRWHLHLRNRLRVNCQVRLILIWSVVTRSLCSRCKARLVGVDGVSYLGSTQGSRFGSHLYLQQPRTVHSARSSISDSLWANLCSLLQSVCGNGLQTPGTCWLVPSRSDQNSTYRRAYQEHVVGLRRCSCSVEKQSPSFRRWSCSEEQQSPSSRRFDSWLSSSYSSTDSQVCQRECSFLTQQHRPLHSQVHLHQAQKRVT